MKLRGPVFEDKVIDLIKSKAKITTKVVSKEALLKTYNSIDQDETKDQSDKKSIEKKEKTKKTGKK